MSYQVLARKWRPQDFASLVGQQPIVTALSNALTDGRIAQAYLFSGIRGVGKTTTARLLAKALNCERGPTADPCNECRACTEITRGSDLDVIEVDAATYSKVEQVRELTESLQYGPARDRYKVVVIDEIHRLSRQAFDALLKIVEEPPSYLVFIFATTESEAVPATVLSRCQEFRFRRVQVAELATHLRALSDAEEITASDAALRLIARAGEGSVRDSVALLDQLATFGAGTIEDEDAARLAGGLDATLFENLLSAILDGEAMAVRETVAQVESEGWDPRHVYAQFLSYCRAGLHLAMGGSVESIDLPADDAASLAERASDAGYENLLRLLHLLLASEETVRRTEVGILAVEIAWLRGAELPKLVRVEELLAGGGGGAAPESRTERTGERRATPPAASQRSRPAPEKTAKATGTPPAAAPDRPADEPAPPSAPAEPRPETPAPAAAKPGGDDLMQAFLDEVSRRKQPLHAYLTSATRIEVSDEAVSVFVSQDDSLAVAALGKAGNRRILVAAAERAWGKERQLAIVEAEVAKEAAATPGKETESSAIPAPGADHPTVQAVLDIFGGTAESVPPPQREEDST